MNLHACLNGLVVSKIVTPSSEEELFSLMSQYTAVIDIEDEIIRPDIGWVLSGKDWVAGELKPSSIKDVTPRQFRQAMILLGHDFSVVDNVINSLPEPHKSLAKIEWEYSTMFIRSNPTLSNLGAAAGFSSEQIDDIFIRGASL
jgi:hypothetical protein